MEMNEHKCMWNHAGTELLISIWAENSVQKQLRSTLRNQPIWDGVARCMMKKGYRVNGKQCRTRIKNILVRYREVKKTGLLDGSGIEPFYSDVDNVMTIRNKQASAERPASSPDVPSTDPLGLAEQKYCYPCSNEYADQEMVQVNIKSEQSSPPTISDYSVQELQDLSQDSSNQQQFFQAVDVTLDDDQSSSSLRMASFPTRRSPLSFVQSDDGTAVCNGKIHLVQEKGYSSPQHGSLNSDSHPGDEAGVTNQSSCQVTMPQLERLIMHSIQAQTEAVTKILTAQSELFMEMMKADRERQARMESKMDCLLERLNHCASYESESTASKSAGNREQDARLNQLLERLEQALPPPVPSTAAARHLEISKQQKPRKKTGYSSRQPKQITTNSESPDVERSTNNRVDEGHMPQ